MIVPLDLTPLIPSFPIFGEPAEDIAAFAEVMEQIERKNRYRLFYNLFPNKGMV